MFNIKQEPFDECMAVDEPQAIEPSEEETNLIINYLPPQMRDQELGDMFDEFGLIRSVKIVRDKSTGESKGYGFVNFELASNANRARIFLDGSQVANKIIKVAFARPSSSAIQKAKLYVSNLPKGYQTEDLLNTFGRYGAIDEIKIMRDKQTGKPRGVALVHFQLKASADLAIAEMRGQMMEGSSLPLVVKLAERHTEWKQPGQRTKTYHTYDEAGHESDIDGSDSEDY